MEAKRDVDLAGAAGLISVALLLAFNQVVVKVTTDGFGPVFQAGMRSAGAIGVMALWIWARGLDVSIPRQVWLWGFVSGGFFALEFLLLFSALDLTTVSRASIVFYSMPVWLAIGSHILLPGERLTRWRSAGLVLSMAGVALALVDNRGAGGSFAGDVMALGAAMCWAAIALCVRATPLHRVRPELQLMFQLVTSALVLLALAPAFGPLLRGPELIHWSGLVFQIVAVASLGFLFWFRLLATYKASGVASFSFLSPVFAVLMGWLMLGEVIGPQIWAALVMVAAGIFLINRG
ncbi:MAG: DMT family transporter [Pseudomonadota bacterium]